MATRPIFMPIDGYPYVKEKSLEFEWFPGFSKTQAQKSIRSLHRSAYKQGIVSILEISSKSTLSLGVDLSAFNLMLEFNNSSPMSVECAFQGSKIFEHGGPYQDLYKAPSIEAKKDKRLRASGDVIGFQLFEAEFPTEPQTAFYDWLYLQALSQNVSCAKMLMKFDGFSDIAFNPQKSINCQAKAAALFVSLTKLNLIDKILNDRSFYLLLIKNDQKNVKDNRQQVIQNELPLDFPEGGDLTKRE